MLEITSNNLTSHTNVSWSQLSKHDTSIVTAHMNRSYLLSNLDLMQIHVSFLFQKVVHLGKENYQNLKTCKNFQFCARSTYHKWTLWPIFEIG